MRAAAFLTVLWVAVGCNDEPELVQGIEPAAPEPVVVRILEPTEGALLNGPLAFVSGEVSGTSQTEVTVNGQPTPASHGRFQVWVPVDSSTTAIEVAHPESGASDRVTVTIDDLPPAIVISGPPRGTNVSGASAVQLFFSAQDENGIVRVEAAGQVLVPEAGEWTVLAPLQDGLNTLFVEVEDTAGNVARNHVSVMSGTFGDESAVIENAVMMHLGQTGLSAFNELVSSLADSMDFTEAALGMNPLIDTSLATVNVQSATISPGTVAFVGATTDRLRVELTVHDLTAQTQLILHTDSQPTYDVDLFVETTHVEVPLFIRADGGEYTVELEEPVFEFVGPVVTIETEDGEPAGAGLEGPVLESLERLLVDSALTLGVDVLQGMLTALTEPFEYEITGTPVSIQLDALDVDVGDHGIELRLDGSLTVDGATVVPNDPGVLLLTGAESFRPRGETVTVALNANLLHVVGHAVWRTGNLRLRVDQEMLDSVNASIAFVAGFLGGVADLVGSGVDPEDPLILEIDTPFPPVMADVPNNDSAGIALGEASLAFSTPDVPLTTGVVTLRLRGGTKDAGGDALELDLGPYDIGFDLEGADLASTRRLEGAVEPVVVATIEELSPLFSTLIGRVPLPDFGPVRPVGIEAGDAGTKGRWLVLRGLLLPAN